MPCSWGNPDQAGWRQHPGSQDLGASPRAILGDIVLPLIRPGIWVALLLSFVRSLADFGTPVIIGGRFSTIASEIYLQLVGYSNLEKASAMNMVLMLPSIAVVFHLPETDEAFGYADRGKQRETGAAGPFTGKMRGGRDSLKPGKHNILFYDGSAVRMHIHIRLPQKHQGSRTSL